MTTTQNNNQSYGGTLAVTVCIFFFWGFAASSNALLIPVLKQQFQLRQFQAQLVELAFYMAYFSGSLLYFFLSSSNWTWMKKRNSKEVMVAGLLISALGTWMLTLAAGSSSYMYFLLSLFVIGIGFSFQQIIANPLLITLGGEKSGTHRLILAGAVNSFGNTIGPLVLSYFIFGNPADQSSAISLTTVKPLFLVIILLYIVFAIWFSRVSLPVNQKNTNEATSVFNPFRYPQLAWGMLAIFCYVGSEVTIQSNLPALIASDTILGLPAKNAVHYFSLFGGSLLIGRWTASLFNFNIHKKFRNLLLFIVPIGGFCLVLAANWISGSELSEIADYFPVIFLLSIILFITQQQTEKILLYAAALSCILLVASFLFSGKASLYCIIGVALFSSLMWPCIFMMATKGMGIYASRGSSLLIMMIVGGAIIPPIQGILADTSGIGIHKSFLLPLLCHVYILSYAWKFSNPARYANRKHVQSIRAYIEA